MHDESRIYVLDEIVVQPGRAAEYHHAYLSHYAPGAQARGMRFESARMSPPLEVDGQPSTLRFTWSVADPPAWWSMRLAALADPTVHAFWKDTATMVVSRSRRFLRDLPALPRGATP